MFDAEYDAQKGDSTYFDSLKSEMEQQAKVNPGWLYLNHPFSKSVNNIQYEKDG